MPTCKSCGTEIIWRRVTVHGRAMPIDADPHPDGNIRLDRDGKTAHMVTRGELEQGVTGDLYRSHFATCPHAKDHRKTRR